MRLSNFQDATEAISHIADIFPFLPEFSAETAKIECRSILAKPAD